MKIPKIPEGKGYLGPMYFGCCSIRPAIFHSKGGNWIVGPEIYAREVFEKGGHFNNKRLHKFNNCTVKVFKNRSSAVKYFVSLRSEIEAWNENHKAG